MVVWAGFVFDADDVADRQAPQEAAFAGPCQPFQSTAGTQCAFSPVLFSAVGLFCPALCRNACGQRSAQPPAARATGIALALRHGLSRSLRFLGSCLGLGFRGWGRSWGRLGLPSSRRRGGTGAGAYSSFFFALAFLAPLVAVTCTSSLSAVPAKRKRVTICFRNHRRSPPTKHPSPFPTPSRRTSPACPTTPDTLNRALRLQGTHPGSSHECSVGRSFCGHLWSGPPAAGPAMHIGENCYVPSQDVNWYIAGSHV